MEQSKNKKVMLSIIGVAILVIGLVGITYAFFNYTRTGTSNTIRVGRISFNSSQAGNINLTNAFPITSTQAETDTTNAKEVSITIEGDTDYTGGVEYLVSASDVNLAVNGKQLPVALEISVEGNNSKTLGTLEAGDYYTNRDNYQVSKYKIEYGGKIEEGSYLLVGYIAPNTVSGTAEGVSGVITIKAYLDKEKILISDTYDGTESDNMGTPNSMAEGKTVFTTTEWNSIQANGLSFKVKVEANEGIWVGDPMSRNDMKNISGQSIMTFTQKSAITEINFVRMSEEMINTHADLIDLTADGGQGVVKAWIDGTKLNIASPGETYLPVDSNSILSAFTGATKINFNNINTSLVENMNGMFANCPSLERLDLSSFDTRNVTIMNSMFIMCSSLVDIDLSSFDTSNVTVMSNMFKDCSNLVRVDISNFDTSSVTNMAAMFNGCSNLISLDLSNKGGNSLSSISSIIDNATNLKYLNMSGFVFGTSTLAGAFSSTHDIDSIETIDLSGAIINNGYLGGAFSGRSTLKTIDLSNVVINNNITSLESMFYNDSSLTTIYVSNDWNIGNETGSYNMFAGCTSLVGGQGTTYDANHIDKTYAHIDGGLSNPGYFTLKTN